MYNKVLLCLCILEDISVLYLYINCRRIEWECVVKGDLMSGMNKKWGMKYCIENAELQRIQYSWSKVGDTICWAGHNIYEGKTMNKITFIYDVCTNWL